MNSKQGSFIESIIIIAIVLVLIQTFLEDLSIVLGWDWTARRILLTAGFGFDLFFTLEFLIRFFAAVSRREGIEYLLHRKGWIDFFASLPLLLFNSSPTILVIYFGGAAVTGLGGVFNILKIAKAVRIARILRLLRVLKIFKQIKYTGSLMAQRHISLITTLTVTVTVLTIFLISFVQQTWDFSPGVAAANYETEKTLFSQFDGSDISYLKDALPSLLIIKEGNETIYSRYENSYYRTFFGPLDYRFVRKDGFDFFFSLKPMMVDQSVQSLGFFILIVLLVLALLLYYSPHFAITVSDPIHIMKRGFEEPSYNLEVVIPNRYRSDEVFKLAAQYNEVYLPLKERDRRGGGRPHSDLSIENIPNLFKKG